MPVYFITAPTCGMVKIGQSQDPWIRLGTAQVNSPVQLDLRAIVDGIHEKTLHERFSAARVRGEWFTITAEIEAFLASLPQPVKIDRRFKPWRKPRQPEIVAAAS
jgi:hypothetical protein